MLLFVLKNWWVYVLRGSLAVIFGVLALVWPGLTLSILIILFGIYAFIEGLVSIAFAIKHRKEKNWWMPLLEGLVGLCIGGITFLWPAVTAVALLIFIALWAIITGVLEIAAAIQLRKEMKGEWILGMAGIFSILVGILLISNPGTGALAAVWLIGLYAIIFGALMVYLGFNIRIKNL